MTAEGIAGSSRFGKSGAVGAATAEEALFLKVFSGEVLAAFARTSVTSGRVNTRTLTSGKSAQFPLLGKFTASYHVPGENIIMEGAASPTYLTQPEWNEKVISIDGILQSSTLIHDIDEAMSHYEVRSQYSREMGEVLAMEFDKHTLQTIMVGSEKSTTISSGGGDWSSSQTRSIVNADFTSTPANDALDTLRDINIRMDKDDVPRSGRHVAVEPEVFHWMLTQEKIVSADYSNGTGQTGSGGMPMSLNYLGMQIHPTNRIADVRGLASSSTWANHSEQHGTDYSSNSFHQVLALAWQETASVGVVRLKDIGLLSDYKPEYLGTFMLAGFSVGHGVLHESACYSVVSA